MMRLQSLLEVVGFHQNLRVGGLACAVLGWTAKIDELMAAEASATRDALSDAGRPVREIVLPILDEATLGALMMHFMLETVIIALCSNIDPFNQPSVERGKVFALDNLRYSQS